MILVRPLTAKDLDDMVKVEEETWGTELRANRETLSERIKRFPDGFLGCYVDGKLVGMTYGHPITDVKNTWYDNSSKQAFDSSGKIFYIVNVGVSENYRGQGIGSKLLDENKKLARELGTEKIVLGARNKEDNLGFYRKNGFVDINKVEGYLPEDKESDGTGVLMELIL